MDEHISVKEAAARLGVHPNTIRYRLEHGLMQGERVLGRVWLIPASEVDRVRFDDFIRRGRKPRTTTTTEG